MPPKKSFDAIYNDVSNKMFDIKEKLTDQEYKELIENIGELRVAPQADPNLYVFEYYSQNIMLDEDGESFKEWQINTFSHKILCRISNHIGQNLDNIRHIKVKVDKSQCPPYVSETDDTFVPFVYGDERGTRFAVKYPRILPISINKYTT